MGQAKWLTPVVIPDTWMAETGGWYAQDQPRQHGDTSFISKNKTKHYFKNWLEEVGKISMELLPPF